MQPTEKLDKKSRMDFVEKLILEGDRPSDIYYKCHKRFGFTRKRTNQYIEWVKKSWKELPTIPPEQLKDQYQRRLELIVNMALEAKEYGSAIKAQDMLNKMIGAYTEHREQNDGPGIITISDNSKPVRALKPGRSEVIDAEATDVNEGTTS